MNGGRARRAWAHLLVAALLLLLAAGLVGTAARLAAGRPDPVADPTEVASEDASPPAGDEPTEAAAEEVAEEPTEPQQDEGAAAEPEAAEAPAVVAADPVRIVIPDIGVDARVVPIGLTEEGALAVPDFGLAGWYQLGPRPGDPGPAVIAAHVDSRAGPDVFYRLRELVPGAVVRISDAAGTVHEFTVSAVEQHDKDELPADRIWSDEDAPALRLITCGGAFDYSVRHYTDNVIVFAEATGG
ncbi:MAG TPA: class F sortase [Egibacteraceae bacterium]